MFRVCLTTCYLMFRQVWRRQGSGKTFSLLANREPDTAEVLPGPDWRCCQVHSAQHRETGCPPSQEGFLLCFFVSYFQCWSLCWNKNWTLIFLGVVIVNEQVASEKRDRYVRHLMFSLIVDRGLPLPCSSKRYKASALSKYLLNKKKKSKYELLFIYIRNAISSPSLLRHE